MRHAESKFNVDRNNQLKDCDITENGKKQCEDLVFNKEFDLVLCSPLKRAIKTYRYSNISCKKFKILDILREHKTDFCDFFENEDVITESVDNLMKRINKFKELLKGLNNVLVIGHSDFFWYLTSNIVENERFGTWLKNCEIVEYNLLSI